MEYSAFISYRRGNNHEKMEKTATKFKKVLLERLRLKDNLHNIYIDVEDKDRGIEKSLATKLCKSVFLIVFYHRPYCQYHDNQAPWCLQELVTFEQNAAEREKLLAQNGYNNFKMIIPILLDDETIKPSCFNGVLPFKLDLTPSNPFTNRVNIKTIQEIVEYIHTQTDTILKSAITNDLFVDCENTEQLVAAEHPVIMDLRNKFKPYERKPLSPKWV
jgi:hypothetical protein